MPILLGASYENSGHRLLKGMTITCKADGAARPEAKGSAAGDRRWEIPDGTKDVELEISVPSPAGGAPLVSSKQKLGVVAGPPAKLNPSGGWGPRVTHAAGIGVEKKAGGAMQLRLDLRFLDVTDYAAKKGATYSPTHGSRFAVLEYTGGKPACWAVLLPPSIPAKAGPEEPGVVMFLRPTGKAAYTNTDDLATGLDSMFPRYVGDQPKVPPEQLGAPDLFPSYQECGWERQLVASKKKVILLFPLPHGSDHGAAAGPTAASLTRSAVIALWDSKKIGDGHAIRPGRLALAGYSHGGKMAMTALGFATNHDLIQEAYLFDPASFPFLKGNLTTWYAKGGKTARLIAGGYQHGHMVALLPSLSAGTASVWAPSMDFWFTSAIYHGGLSRRGGPIEKLTPAGTTPAADTPSARSGIFLESYKIDPKDPMGATKLVVSAQFGKDKKTQTLTGVSHEEAAAILYHTVIPKYGGGKPATAANFATLVGKITANELHGGEPNRIGSIRHEWTVFGGMEVGGSYIGYFQRCLENSGFT